MIYLLPVMVEPAHCGLMDTIMQVVVVVETGQQVSMPVMVALAGVAAVDSKTALV
jgi:hypothetical protein